MMHTKPCSTALWDIVVCDQRHNPNSLAGNYWRNLGISGATLFVVITLV